MGKTNNTPVPQQDGGNEYLDTIYNSYVEMAPQGKTPLSKEAFAEKLNDEEYRSKVLNSLKSFYDGINDDEFNAKLPIKKKEVTQPVSTGSDENITSTSPVTSDLESGPDDIDQVQQTYAAPDWAQVTNLLNSFDKPEEKPNVELSEQTKQEIKKTPKTVYDPDGRNATPNPQKQFVEGAELDKLYEKTFKIPGLTAEENNAFRTAAINKAEAGKQLEILESDPNTKVLQAMGGEPLKLQLAKETIRASNEQMDNLLIAAKFRDTERYFAFYDSDTLKPVAIPKAEMEKYVQEFMDNEFKYRKDIVNDKKLSSEFKGKKFSELEPSQQLVVQTAFAQKYIPKDQLQEYMISQNINFDLNKLPSAGNKFMQGFLNTSSSIVEGADPSKLPTADGLNAAIVKAKTGMITKTEYERVFSEIQNNMQVEVKDGFLDTYEKLPGITPVRTYKETRDPLKLDQVHNVYTEDQIARYLGKMPKYEDLIKNENLVSPYTYENGQLGKVAEGLNTAASKMSRNPVYDESFLISKVPEALGSSAAFVATSLITRGLKLPSTLATAITGGFANASESYNQAIQSGASPDKARLAYWGGFGIGTTEVIPIERMLNRFHGGQGWKQKVIETFNQGNEELLQETFQGLSNDVLAKLLWDESKKIGADLKSQAAVGWVSGFLMGGVTALGSRPDITPEQQQMLEEIKKNIQFSIDRADNPTEKPTEKPVAETKTEPVVVAEEDKTVEPVKPEVKPEAKIEKPTVEEKTLVVDKQTKKADIERRRQEDLLGKSFTTTTEKVVTGKGQSSGKTIVRYTESKVSSDGEVLTIKPKAKFKNEDTPLSTTPETITVKEFKQQFYENLSEQDKEMFDEFFTDDSTRIKLVEARIGLKGSAKGQVNIDIQSLDGQPFGFELQNGKEINAKYDAELKALEQQPTSTTQSEIEAKKADIERRRQEELKSFTEREKESVKKSTKGTPINKDNPNSFKVGQEYNDGMLVIVQDVQTADNFDANIAENEGEGYTIIDRVLEYGEMKDGKQSKAPILRTRVFNNKEDADTYLEQQKQKFDSQIGKSRQYDKINAKYDAELKADLAQGKVGNTHYEVKADGVYFEGKKLDNPDNKTHKQLIEADIERRRQEDLDRPYNKKKQELSDITEIASYGETYGDALNNLIKKQEELNNALNKRQKEDTKDREVKQYTKEELEAQPEWKEIKRLDRLIINEINDVYGSAYGFDAKTSDGVKEVEQELKELPNKRKTADSKINAKYDAERAALENQPTSTTQSEIEAKKADIERRRQEELKQPIKDKLQEIEKAVKTLNITIDKDGKLEQTSDEIITNIKSELDKIGLPYKEVVSNEKGSSYKVITNDGTEIEVVRLLKSGGALIKPVLSTAKFINHLIKTEPQTLRDLISNQINAKYDAELKALEGRQTQLNIVKVYHHTSVAPQNFDFSNFQRGKNQISQFGDGLNAATTTNDFFVSRYGNPIEGEVKDSDFIVIDANKSEKELYEELRSKGYKFNNPATGSYIGNNPAIEYDSKEKANEQPAIISLFNDFQKSNPQVKGVKIINHIIGNQKVDPFYVIYDAKSFYGLGSLSKKSTQAPVSDKKADIERRKKEAINNIRLVIGAVNPLTKDGYGNDAAWQVVAYGEDGKYKFPELFGIEGATKEEVVGKINAKYAALEQDEVKETPTEKETVATGGGKKAVEIIKDEKSSLQDLLKEGVKKSGAPEGKVIIGSIEKPTISKKETVAEKVKSKIKKIEDSELDDLIGDFLETGKKFTSGVDPEYLAKGLKVIAKYTQLGVLKFADMVLDLTARIGEANVSMLLPAMKKAYVAHWLDMDKSVSEQMDEPESVKQFDYDNFLNEINGADNSTISDTDGTDTSGVSEGVSTGTTEDDVSTGGTEDVSEQSGSDLRGESGQTDDGGDESAGGTGSGNGKTTRTGRGGNGAGTGTTKRGTVRGDIERPAELSPERNHQIKPDDVIVPKGEIGKIKANIAALELLQKLDKAEREATPDEKKVLAQWTGWGGLAPVFDELIGNYVSQSWTDKYGKYSDKLKELLTESEINYAVASTVNAHYTSKTFIEKMWGIAEQLGFNGGNVLEPAGGIGHFFGLMPEHLADKSKLIGYELDPISGRIFKKLYPEAKIQVTGYENAVEGNNTMDLVITNVPFAQQAPFDERNKDLSKFSLHNYFIAKGIRQLKPGGIGVFITSMSSMDNNASIPFRKWVINEGNADFIGAIRLPNTAFKDNAGTEVTTDILIFRKKIGDAINDYSMNGEFINTDVLREAITEDGAPTTIRINKYFIEHPEMMLGEMKLAHEVNSGGLYSADDQTMIAKPGEDINALMDAAVEKLPEDIFGSDGELQANMELAKEGDTPNTLVFRDGKLGLVDYGVLVEPEWANKTITGSDNKKHSMTEVAKEFIGIKESVNKLLSLEQSEESTDEEIEDVRKQLNTRYDLFVKKYGPLYNNRKISDLEDDVEFFGVSALENIERIPIVEGKKTKYAYKIGKSQIFSKRISYPIELPKNAENVLDALNISLSWKGGVDKQYIAQLLGKPESEIETELLQSGLVFMDPDTGLLVDKNEYLSGNVREKLERAIQAEKTNPSFAENVKALESVQPARRSLSSINFRIASNWLPPEIIKDFIAEKMGVSVDVKYDTDIANWIFEVVSGERSALNTTEYGMHGFLGTELVRHALSMKEPIYQYKDYEGNIKKDPQKTLELKTRIEEIENQFFEYTNATSRFKETIENIYNERFNSYVEKSFDLENIERFPGQVKILPNGKEFKMRMHQSKGVLRALQNSTLLAHDVGSGKTITMVTAAMEMRRLKLAKKPMIVVQNATVDQFASTFKMIYPQSKVLIPTKKDREAKNRKRLLAKIAFNDWDAVVIPQSFLDFIQDDPLRVRAIIDEEIAKIKDKIATLGKGDEFVKKALEKEIKKLEDSLVSDYFSDTLDQNYKVRQNTNSATKRQYPLELISIKGQNKTHVDYFESMAHVNGYLEQLRIEKQAQEDAQEDQSLGQKGKKAKARVKDVGKKISKVTARIAQQSSRRTDKGLTFEKMGIDALFVDEAHNYKKLGFQTELSKIKGIDSGRSKRAFGLSMKVKWVQEQNKGRNVITATGTPITNTMAEAWTMLRYVAPEVLKDYGITEFDQFASSFGSIMKSLEFGTTGTFKMVDRFKSFVNIHEFLRAWKSRVDVVLKEDIKEFKEADTLPKLKDGKTTDLVLVQSPALKRIMNDIKTTLETWENLPGKEKMTKRHWPLVMFNRAKQAAIDVRLVDPALPDDPDSKTNAVIKEVLRIYNQSNEYKGTQMVFCDMYQSSEAKSPYLDDEGTIRNPAYGKARFNLFEDMKKKLIDAGVPENEIEIVHDAQKTEKKWEETKEKFRNGSIRIMLGTTEKMGVGVDVQQRMTALHHMDAPPRPMDFTQRNGRIIRQGNLHADWGIPIEVLTYGVEKTLDATAYGRLDTKQNFINQVLKGNISLDETTIDEIGGDDDDVSSMSFGDMMATLSGSQYAILAFKAKYDYERIRQEFFAYQNRQRDMESEIGYLERSIPRSEKDLEDANNIAASFKSVAFPDEKVTKIKIDGKSYIDKLSIVLSEHAEKLNDNNSTLEVVLNDFVKISVSYNNTDDGKKLFIYLDNKYDFISQRFPVTSAGLLQSINSKISKPDEKATSALNYLNQQKDKLQVLKNNVGKRFSKLDKLDELKKKYEEYSKLMEAESNEIRAKERAEFAAEQKDESDSLSDDLINEPVSFASAKRKKVKATIEEAIRKLQQAFPNVTVKVLPQEQFDIELEDNLVQKLSDEFTNYGFFNPRTGEIVLNQSEINPNAAIEEFSHLWLHLLKNVNNPIYVKGEALAKQQPLFEELKTDEAYRAIWNDDAALANEVMAKMIRDKVGDKLDSAGRNWIQQFWDAVKNMLRNIGFNLDQTNINTLTFEQLVDKATKDLTRGTPVTYMTSEQVAKLNDAEGPVFIDNDLVSQIINPTADGKASKWLKHFLRSNFMLDRGAGKTINDIFKRHDFDLNARRHEMSFLMKDMRKAIKQYAKTIDLSGPAKDDAISKVLQNMNAYLHGEIELYKLPLALQHPAVKVRTTIDQFTRDLMQARIALDDDIIFGINDELELYLQTNFEHVQALTSRLKQQDEKLKKHLREISEMDMDTLNNHIGYLHGIMDKFRPALRKRHLANLQAAIERNKARLDRDISPELEKLLAKYQDMISTGNAQLPAKQRAQMTEEEKATNKKIREARKELESLMNREREYTFTELDLMDQIREMQEYLEDADLSRGPSNESEMRMHVQQLATRVSNIEKELIEAEKEDLGVESVDFKKNNEGAFDLKLNHVNGKTTEFWGVPFKDMEILFGDSVARKMLTDESGFHQMNNPTILENNKLFARMMDNMGKYVTRSYQAHDNPNFAKDWRKIVGTSVRNDAFMFIKTQYTDPAIHRVNVIKTPDGQFNVVFVNKYGIKSNPIILNSLGRLTIERNGPLSKKTVDYIQKRLEVDNGIVELALPRPTNAQSFVKFPISREQIEGIMDRIVTKDGYKNMYQGMPINGFDGSIFKQKGDIPEPIRKLMGEYTDPYINSTKTLLKMAAAIENGRLVQDMINEGPGVFFSEKQTNYHSVKITKSEVYSLGDKTYFVTPEVYDALFAKSKKKDRHWFYQTLITLSASAKAANTIYYPESQARNFFGAALNMIATGNFNFGDLKYAIAISSQDLEKHQDIVGSIMSTPLFVLRLIAGKTFGYNGKAGKGKYDKDALRDNFIKASQYGVINESLDASVINDLHHLLSDNKMKERYTNVTDSFAKPYQLSDNVFKVTQWLNEMETLKKAYPDKSNEWIMEHAADIVRRLSPTYSMLPEAVQRLGRFPLIGSFVMFPTAMIKTRVEIIKQIASELASGNEALIKHAALRMAGLTGSISMGYILFEVFKNLFNWDDDENEAVNKLSPSYAQNNLRLYISADKKNVEFIDLTYIDPSSIFYKSIIAFNRDEGKILSKTKSALGEVTTPYVSTDIFTAALFESLEGKDEYGIPIYYRTDSDVMKMLKGTGHTLEAVLPKFLDSYERLYMASTGKETEYGRTYELDNELANLMLGAKSRTIDEAKSGKTKVRNANQLMLEPAQLFKQEKLSLDEANSRSVKYFNEIQTYVSALKELGFADDEIYGNFAYKQGHIKRDGGILSDAGVSRYMIQQLENGTFEGIDEDGKTLFNK